VKFETYFRKDPNDKNDTKNKFLSRIFGIFSEEIVNIWCSNDNAPYKNIGRPTIYTKEPKKGHYTLDFTFKDKDNKKFIVEMKSEIQYENYKYMILQSDTATNYLKHHQKKTAFQLFLNLKNNRISVKKEEINNLKSDGSILVWGSLSNNFNLNQFNTSHNTKL